MMLDKIPLENILFLDIETIPQTPEYSQLPENFQALWDRKALRFSSANQEINSAELYFEKAGIFSEFGKIICISAGYFIKGEDETDLQFRCKAFYSDDEKQLLEDFASLLNKYFSNADKYLCGHNAREFDFPYIARRMLINQIPLPDILNLHGRKPWEVTLLDTLDLWKFGDYKNYTSLALLAAVFNLPTPKDDIEGKDVARVYWEENDLKRIAIYCSKDVVTTARVYLKYCLKGDLPDENVVIVD
jgi:3'-5' exonuclease